MRIEVAVAALLAWTAHASSWSQVSVPPAAQSDPAALETAIPELACQALSRDVDAAIGLDERFRLQFTCGRYEQALESLERMERQIPARADRTLPWIRLELHARATLLASKDGISYRDAFNLVFANEFSTLNDLDAVNSAWMLGLPPGAARANLVRQLRQHANKSSLTRNELLDISFWHSAWQSTQAFSPVLDAAIALDDSKRFTIDRGVLVRTRHGATLALDVVRPRRHAGPQPTALRFTIYSDPVFNLKSAKEAAARGYVGVLASARGKYLSTDEIVPWETEVHDTWAVIDWISRQPWSDGKVGMYGNSYDAFAQWAAAKQRHPALKTIVPSGATHPGFGLPMQNNVFQSANYGWPLQVSSDRYMGDPALRDRNRWASLVEKWFYSGRPFREIDAIDGIPNRILQRQMRHPSFDEYWRSMQPDGKEFAEIRIPVLSLTGYFDDAGASALRYVVQHYLHDRNARHYLVIGPWSHDDNMSARKSATVNGYAIDRVADVDTEALVFEWFDHVLRGGPQPALLKDRINFEVMGANTWSHAPSIDKMANRTLRLYLTADSDGQRFALSPDQPAAADFVEQSVDLADRRTRNNLYPVSAFLEKPDGPTAISFISAPFHAPVCVCGQITGALQATIDRMDFDFTWALYEATPDGKFFNLSYYLARASYAADPSVRKLLSPGRPTALPFSQTPLIAKQLAAGSRLLLLLTVNKNPFAQVNYGTGRDVSDESIDDADKPLKVQWHGGSFIDVPLRDAGIKSGPEPLPTRPARD